MKAIGDWFTRTWLRTEIFISEQLVSRETMAWAGATYLKYHGQLGDEVYAAITMTFIGARAWVKGKELAAPLTDGAAKAE